MKKITVTKSSMPPYSDYIEMIKPLWDTRWLTNMGSYHNQLEQKLKQYLNVQNISLMVNGHMALELTIQAMNFPKGSEIITTPFTFISTTHAIIRNQLKPIFCDIKLLDGTIDESKIENLITEKTVAILPVHVYGNICNIKKIEEIAFRYSLKVIYDAAHAFGETYHDIEIGNFGDASVFSFHATKVFHTVEGGAVAFKDYSFYDKLYNLKNFGIRSEEVVASVGTNAKMNEFQAIMGLCNLKYLSQEINKRQSIYERYKNNLSSIDNIEFIIEEQNIQRNYAYAPLNFKDQKQKLRDIVYKELVQNNIYTRKYFYPITPDQVCFKNKYKNISVPNARFLSNNILALPLYSDISLETVDIICAHIKKVCNYYKST